MCNARGARPHRNRSDHCHGRIQAGDGACASKCDSAPARPRHRRLGLVGRKRRRALAGVGEGSEPAFGELRHRYRRAIERSCRQIVGGELEDCAQEVFVRIWRKAALYDRGRGSAPAWLLTLARRTALSFRQRREVPGSS
jgi:hypothetical protein